MYFPEGIEDHSARTIIASVLCFKNLRDLQNLEVVSGPSALAGNSGNIVHKFS